MPEEKNENVEEVQKEIVKNVFKSAKSVFGGEKNKWTVVDGVAGSFEIRDANGELVCSCTDRRRADVICLEHSAAAEFMAMNVAMMCLEASGKEN